MIFEIPLMLGTPQKVSINLGGADVQLSARYWDAPEGGWTLDIDDSNGNPIVHGIALVTGIDLLSQYRYLGFGGGLFVQTLSDPDAVPTFDNLGGDCKLYWVPA